MKPLISYYGGKQRIASRIVDVINTIPHQVYCEPFFGSGAVFFARQKPYVTNDHHFREVINDKDELLVNLYRIARDNPDEFNRLIRLTPYSKSEHRKAKEICKNPQCNDEITKAWAYYVNINQSFSCGLNKGWGRSRYSRNHAQVWHNKKLNIPDCLERLDGVFICCDDALKVIANWDCPNTLFYLDPPYPETNQGHYSGYTIECYRNLCELLDEIKGSYILSNYCQGDIYPKSYQDKIEISAVMSSKKGVKGQQRRGDKRKELLWVCSRTKRRQQLTLF